jgi:hypothetical protein
MIGYNDNIENQATRMVSNTNQPSNDCIIKGMILKILNEADRPLRGKEIFDGIPYDNYNSFRVLLSRYSGKKYNYIEKIKLSSNSHYLYQISKTGRMHAQNPFIFREKYKARQAKDREHFLTELLNNPENMSYYFGNMDNLQVRTVFDTVQKYVDSNSLRDFGDEGDNHQSVDDEEIDYEDKYMEAQEEIKNLKSQNFNLQVKLTQRPTEAPRVQENKLPSTVKNKRYDLLCSWEGKHLTSSFFSHELIPYDVLVKVANKDAIQAWKQKFNINSDDKVGIFSRTISSTLLKEKIYREANDSEIQDARFYLIKNRGIRIISKKYKSINKVVLKQSEIPNNAASSKNAPQVKIRIDKNRK